MPIRIVPVNNGLVTARDASMLSDGELTQADDSYYRPNDPALWKIRGRSAFNASPESASIKGLRFLAFDGATDLYVNHVGTTYRSTTAALSGTWANLVTGLTGGTKMDSVHYNNIHYLMNGVDRNRAVSSDGTAVFHGMLAATTAPTADATTGTGITLTSNSTLIYWVEERVKDGDTILRRNATLGTDFAVTVTGPVTNKEIIITRPAVLNSDATHWALYATATNGTFPTGAEIAEVVIGTTTISDTRSGSDPSIPGGSTYELLSVSVAGTIQNTARNGPPPIATTGDVFEDSLVMNDSTNRSLVRYSYFDRPNQWPSLNFIRFETKEEDEVRLIRTVGRSVVVLMRDSAWRVDTLPRPEDAAFQIERVKEQIHGAHGVVGSYAADVFSFGQGIRLAYISPYGLLVTDGFSWDVLTDDIDWEATVKVSALSSAVLVNNPKRWRLEMYYTPAGGTANTKALYFHYHPSHAKASSGGGFRTKITGPINAIAASAMVSTINGEYYVFTGNTDGVAYQEDVGNSDASTAGGITYKCFTGDIFQAGIGNQSNMKRVWVHHSASANQTGTVSVVQRLEGQDDVTKNQDISLTRREHTKASLNAYGDAMQLGVANSDSSGQISIDFFAADFDPSGRSTQ